LTKSGSAPHQSVDLALEPISPDRPVINRSARVPGQSSLRVRHRLRFARKADIRWQVSPLPPARNGHPA
jgi:hypothetical protein